MIALSIRSTGPAGIRSRQGVNLPGATLHTPPLTDKDREDLAWALDNRIDYIGLSFVRSAEDIVQLREAIASKSPRASPGIVAKIEKMEGVAELGRILPLVDAIMVARGDWGWKLTSRLFRSSRSRSCANAAVEC